ncbi:MAG: TonB-dependent receptor [Gammaproteobacteria bacterium]|nr:TonB-dependent receptor [Gammaproteobacteria bacterium]
MSRYRHLASGVLSGVGALALASTGYTQATDDDSPGAKLEEVVITGSRAITNGNDSPTPVTVVSLDELQSSRPTTVFEGLQELPVFSSGNGGSVGGRTGQGGNNNSIASLNLRGLGSVRGLVLFNGHRVPPQNLNGQVDLNQIPQLVLQRVDVQTGGSSAVYGSDAITGAVNFIVNRSFNGLKLHGQYGFDDRGDTRSNEIGVAFGTDLFGGRGHFLGSAQSHYDSGLLRSDRPWTQPADGYSWSLQGNGSAAAPYFTTQYAVDRRLSYGGVIVCPGGTPGASGAPVPGACPTRPLVGLNFSGNGLLTPFVNGSSQGLTGNNQIGGDGANTNQKVSLKVPVKFFQFYGRFDFALTDRLHFFAESYFTKESQFSWLANARSSSSANNSIGNGFIMSRDNAFLPAAYRDLLVAGGATTFNVGKVWDNNHYPGATFDYDNRNLYANAGLDGQFGNNYSWEISGTRSRANQANVAHNTWDTGRLFAALDAVINPANGQVVCQVSLTANAGLYPGCVPMNIFGPTATTPGMWEYVRKPTRYEGITETTDFEGQITGAPFSTWAGEVNLALSAEWRKLEYELISGGEPANVDPVDCTGLRFNCVSPSATNVGTSIFPNGSAGLRPVSQTVKEAAIEADLPLLADVRFARRIALNPAFRRAEYSATGTPSRDIPVTTTEFQANTWKVGLNWQLNDALTLRATRSRDFRAPNMSELYLPGRVQGFTVTDRLTNVTSTVQQQVGGNPNLLPEVGYTTTVGVVLKPTPDLSLSIDAFDISIVDAVTGIDGSSAAVQDACYDSGGSSPYCAFQRRPGGYSRTPANQAAANTATYWITQSLLNLAETRTSGVDVEGNWRTELFGRPALLRALATYQPHIWLMQQLIRTDDAGGVSSPRVRALGSIRIGLTSNLTASWTTRWRSSLLNVSPRVPNHNVVPGHNRVGSTAFSNLTLTYRLPQVTAGDLDLFLNVLNVFDKAPPPYVPLASGSPFSGGAASGGVGFYPADDGIGRYINAGFKYRM